MKKSTILLTLFAAFGLAACGGSDGPDLGLNTVPNVPPGVGGNTGGAGGNTGNEGNNGGGTLPPKKEDIKLDLGANKANLGIDAMTMKAIHTPLYEVAKDAEYDVEYNGVKYKKTDSGSDTIPVVVQQGEALGSKMPAIVVNDPVIGQYVVATVDELRAALGLAPDKNDIPLKEITAEPNAENSRISMLKITSQEAVDYEKKSQESPYTLSREISLDYPGDKPNAFNDGSNSYIGNNMSYARFGALYDARLIGPDVDYGTHFFALGQVTPETDMAKFADVTDAKYEGAAYYSLYSQPVKSYNDGKVSFTVDFKNKDIVGTLELPGTQQKREFLQAKINGNSFEGKHLGGNWMKGKFYGPDAAEVAGIFEGKSRKWAKVEEEPKGFIGSFGAVKK